jgi:hypothetical protein
VKPWALAALSAVLVAGPGTPSTASATMPPKLCGTITVGKKRYTVKADQVPCSFARDWSRRYLTTRSKPRGFMCTRQPPTSRIRVFCRKSYRTFFAQT